MSASASSLEAQFGTALAAYVAHAEEALLGQAYELGRGAMSEGLSIPDLVAMHARALHAILADGRGPESAVPIIGIAAEFLAESLSPYEMTHRGYREAMLASRHLNETLEKEIKRIAHALHDEAGQLLVSVHLALAELEVDFPPQAADPRLRQLKSLLDQVENQLRDLSHELRPTVLDDLGWLPAIQFLADAVSRRAHLPVEVLSTATGRLNTAVETALYRVVQEALTNVVRHSRAGRVRIQADREGSTLVCQVEDDGIGFEAAASNGHAGLGLKGMRERLNAVGGQLQVISLPGDGTRIRLQVPVEG
jgi:signal transduction histidine kinase